MNENLVVRKVKVRGLFGRFNYNLDFETGSAVSILIAPNGTGKSTIFDIVKFLIDPTQNNLQSFIDKPFEYGEVELADGYQLILENKNTELNDIDSFYNRISKLVFSIKKNNEIISLTNLEANSVARGLIYCGNRKLDEKYNDWINSEEEMNRPSYFLTENNNAVVSAAGLYDYLSERLINEDIEDLLPSLFIGLIRYLVRRIGCIHCIKHISADRINDRQFIEEFLQLFSKDINAALSQFDISEAEKEKQINKRLLNKHFKGLSYQQYLLRLDKIEEALSIVNKYIVPQIEIKELEQLRQAATIINKEDSQENIQSEYSLQAKEYCARVFTLYSLTEYLRDMAQPTDKFLSYINGLNDIAEIELFITTDVKNNKYNLKVRNTYNKNNVFNVQQLSSGQKHILAMYYQLFYVKEFAHIEYDGQDSGPVQTTADIIIVDEPEISQHIEVQERIMDELMELADMRSYQILVATHSPFVVGSHTELLVDKEVWKNE